MKSLARITATEIAPIEELKGWAELAVKAQIIPSNMNAFQAMALVQAGKEMGLQPLQSLRSMSFIKGRLTMSVQLQLAMAKNRGVTMDDPDEGDGYCEVTLHRGKENVTCRYTREDARKAGLISTGSNWDKYERQMLRWRAIGDALRLIAPDMVMNLLSPEEAASIEPLAPLPVESLNELSPASPPPSAQAPEGAADPAQKPAVEKPPPAPPKPFDQNAYLMHLNMLVQTYMNLANCTDGEALQEFTKSDDGKFKGFKNILKIKDEWQFRKAIARAESMIQKMQDMDDQDAGLFEG